LKLMKSPLVRLSVFAVCAAASASVPAQTATATQHRAPAPAHHPATAPHAAVSGCVTIPTLSPKIPALPASLGCPKPLYTITSSSSQLSPLLSPQLKESLSSLNQTFTLAYIDTKIGAGALAAPRMFYTVNYTGYLVDGSKFDSSEGKDPITFPYGARRVIQGWDSGFEGMHVGGKRRLFVPYQLAYGEAGRPPAIPAKSMLVFDVELVSQSDQPPAPKTPPTPPAGATGATGSTGASGATGASPATPPVPPPGAATQPAGKPSTPPVTSTTPATTPRPTGSTVPKQ
jgi:peptidylprolyl isomerase